MSSVRTCFPQVQRFFKPQLGDGETFRFWCDNWLGHGRLDRLFPCLYALSTDQGVLVRRAWNDAWVPPLPEALPDQRVAELISLQELLTDCCLSRQYKTRGYGAALASPPGLHTDDFETRRTRRIRSSCKGVVWCGSVASL